MKNIRKDLFADFDSVISSVQLERFMSDKEEAIQELIKKKEKEMKNK